jgi:hypothetical protein
MDRKLPARSNVRGRYLAIWAAFALSPIALVVLVNYLVDPFQFFRVSVPPRFSENMQRLQHPGIVRNYPFNSIVVGNSLIANLRNEMFDRKEFEGLAVQNLSLSGSTLREAAYVVDLALRTKPIKSVYWGIGRQWILTDFRYGEFPTCMYGSIWSRFPYCYLVNAGVFSESIAILFRLKEFSKAGWVDRLSDWKTVGLDVKDKQAFDCDMRREIIGDDVESLTRIAATNLGPGESPEIKRFREIVLPIVRSHRQVRFTFIFSPLHLWHLWFNAVKFDGFWLKLDLAMVHALINEPNAEIHDMTGLVSLTHNAARYDAMHYDLAGSREVVDALASRSMKITSIARHEEMLRREILAGGKMARDALKTNCPD